MKKVLIFLMLIAILCMAACNNVTNDGNNDEKSEKKHSEKVTSSITKEEEDFFGNSNEDTEAELTINPYEGWINVFGQIYIPELPFSDWEGGNQDNISCFTIYIRSNDSAAFHSYVQSLTDFGYTIEQNESYSYKGTDPENRTLHFTDFENGQMQISIYY